MRATILVDNTALFDSPLTAENGFSAYIEADGRRILFDTGYSDTFIENTRRLGIDLFDLDYIVLSHGHNDHTGGLYHLMRLFLEAMEEGSLLRLPRLIAHPHCFLPRMKAPSPAVGPLLTVDEVRRIMPVDLSAAPVQLTPNLVFLGEIERTVPFEKFSPGPRRIVLTHGAIQEDLLLDDTALAYRSRDGLVIMTGCAHSGICSTVEYARRVCEDDRVADIIGGLHLREMDSRLEGTCDYLHGLGLSALHACHCTSLAAKVALASAVPLKETGTGLRLEYRDRP